jgi:hypothetical protein
LDRKAVEAAEQFRLLAAASPDALIAGLAAWFLAGPLRDHTGAYAAAEQGRLRVRKSLRNRSAWDGEVGKLEAEVHAAVLRKYIGEAGDWIFGPVRPEPVRPGSVKESEEG